MGGGTEGARPFSLPQKKISGCVAPNRKIKKERVSLITGKGDLTEVSRCEWGG